MRHEMTGRERVLTAARRQVPDRVLRTISLEPAVYDMLQMYFDGMDLRPFLKDDHAWVWPRASRPKNDYSAYFDRPGATRDEWGRGRIWDSEQHYA